MSRKPPPILYQLWMMLPVFEAQLGELHIDDALLDLPHSVVDVINDK